MKLKPIGKVIHATDGFAVALEPEYRPALNGLQGFGYINVIWWADKCDTAAMRAVTSADKPYVKGPDEVGIFATRSPLRPNPLAVTVVRVLHLDSVEGLIYIPYIDAEPGTPVLDLKPYLPATDRVARAELPEWCRHWPANVEASADFDWAAEFNF